MLSRLNLDSKGQGHNKNQKPMAWGTKHMPPRTTTKFEQGFP